MAATMKDVAREANVALGTVSKVINGIPVGESYRLRVEAAIEKLDYRVNTYARGLKSNRTYTVAVVVPNMTNPYFCKVVNCLNKALAQRDYQMLVCCTDYDPVQEQEYVAMAEQKKVDGIICLSYNPKLNVGPGVPFVSIDRYFGGKIPCVAADNYGGGRLAAEKLIEGGCRELAFFWVGSPLANEPSKRKDGFVAACEAAGVPYHIQAAADGVPFSVFEDYLKANRHDGRLKTDGIFCVTDRLAVQIMEVLGTMGLKVPEDVQVVGFDGVQRFGDMGYYCSTIVQPVEQIAESCVSLILDQDRNGPPTLLCLPVRFASGGTTRERE